MQTIFIILIILLIPVLYDRLFPFKRPNLEGYFSPGDTFTSKGEGITQKVIRQEGNKLYCALIFDPHAAGPPVHMHQYMPESVFVQEGTLSLLLNDTKTLIPAGQRGVIPVGVYHKMFNESDTRVVLSPQKEEDFITVEFAYSLAQIYPIMQKNNAITLGLLAKISVLGNLFDSVPAGPPPIVFRLLKGIIRPYARLFGVTPYDSRTKPN